MPLIEVYKVEKQGGADFQKKHLSRHKHGPEQFELLYIKDGEGLFLGSEGLKPFAPGSMILVPPETIHQLQPERQEDPLQFFSLLFEAPEPQIRNELHGLVSRYNPFHAGSHWHLFFEEMTLRHLNPHPLMVQAGYHRLLSVLFELPAQEFGNKGGETHPAKNQHLSRALEYMEKHLYQHLTLKELCQDLQISEEYLIRLFRKYMGTTPMHHLCTLRINAARLLLEETEMSIKEISWKLRFTDQYHFSRVFKKICGQTPSNYRNTRERRPGPMMDQEILHRK